MKKRPTNQDATWEFCTSCKGFSLIPKSKEKALSVECPICGATIHLSGTRAAATVFRFLEEKVTRRNLLKLAWGLGMAGASGLAYYQFASERFGKSLAERVAEHLIRLSSFATLRDIEFLFADTFHLDAPLTSLSLGKDNYPNGYHADNLAAGLTVAGPLGLLQQARTPTTVNGAMDAPPNADFILIGGPNSTPLTEMAWEFKGPNDRRLVRQADAIIPLTFYGISDERDLPRVGWSMDGQGNVGAPNWPYICTDPQLPYTTLAPEYGPGTITTKNGEDVPLLRTNYLLVTRIPNFLAPNFKRIVESASRDDWPYLLVFEGNHGVGTRGVELLLAPTNAVLLERLQSSTADFPAYQQMFRLGDLDLSSGGFHHFNSIELLGEVAPIRVDDSVWLKANERAQARLSPPGSG